ncbi:MAG: MGH1-like glycoside hydrolase domain-containing protein [Planctomycetota bacterium]
MMTDPEHERLAAGGEEPARWKRWGPYLSERAWGTVREDYSANGDAWNYFPHDHARSRAYRWSEDGIAGFCDDRQYLCLAVALWNGKDPILKERMFGLTNQEGNHGEDVKEYYFFLDGTPTHSYMKMLYKYPHVAYPYEELVRVNGERGQSEPEFELFHALHSAFLANRYFDVFVEYAKADSEDLLCRITAVNRGPDPAPLHVLPHLWYRNTWSWEHDAAGPLIRAVGPVAARTEHPELGQRWWSVRSSGERPVALLFTENETNFERLYNVPNRSRYVKDGIHEAVVYSRADRVNRQQGSKLAGHVQSVVEPGGTFVTEVRFSLTPRADPFRDFDAVFARRIAECDAFYAAVQPARLSDDERLVQRQAYAGLLWSKQFYHYDVYRWLQGDPTQPEPPAERWRGRNHTWKPLSNADVILMPDTWEYPWYASWDLAFHCVAIARIDPACAKQQLRRMGYEWYQHGNGQYPAYEWNFNDVNPPVLAWACWRVYQIEREQTGTGDLRFLEEVFTSLMLSFSFWVNRKDNSGRDVFGGGFLGMDNIGAFDRDQPLPDGGQLEQSDGTSWMARFSISMLSIALELARREPFYQTVATKYFEHFLYIAHAMRNIGAAGIELWDETDQFFYSVVHLPSGENIPLKIHSMVGLVPLLAVLAPPPVMTEGLEIFQQRADWFLAHRMDLADNVAPWNVPGHNQRGLMSILHGDRLVAVLQRMLDPDEFLSDYGVRALSRYHLDHPYVFRAGGQEFTVKYLPAESDNLLFGGNSNWRGPIWFPMNYLIVRALDEYSLYYNGDLKVECPTGSGRRLNLKDVATELARRLAMIFLRDPAHGGRRAVFGGNQYFQTDPHWRDCVPFHEYFHGDNGAGLGASHQTGWTALVASLLHEYGGQHDNG